jgi:HlyD family secretion protein
MTDKPAGAGAGAARSGGGAGTKGPSVWVLENGKPRRVAIQPGITDGTYTEIASGDVKEGQDVIIEALKGNQSKSKSAPRMF